MTRRSDIGKIFAIAAVLAMVFYYLAHYGLACPENVCDVTGKVTRLLRLRVGFSCIWPVQFLTLPWTKLLRAS